ncbi:MAG TPA: CBS domain-containing protein [Polyangiaceae bacterium]|nr:CBS domain-containing protein [Polyangiaceae bacterium]
MASFDAPVQDFMRRELIAVGPNATLGTISALLERHDISAVPVLEDQKLRGIVSIADILRVESDRTLSLTAADVMRTPVVTVAPESPLREAARRMSEHRIHRVIVCEGQRPVGVLSTRDAMLALEAPPVMAPVREVATASVLTVDLSDSIDSALALLEASNTRGLVVLDEDWPVGVFTQTEALRARALPERQRADPVEHVMSYETICMNAATPLYRVARQARAVRVRRILVVDHRQLCGIATGFDLVRWIGEH